jgi:hypothetical protein
MAGDIHRRLAKLETKDRVGKPKFEIWLNTDDGYLRNKEGMTLSREAFDAAFPNARKFTLDIFGNKPSG